MAVLKLPFSSNIGNQLGSDFLKIKTPQNPGVAEIQQSTAPVINTKLNQGTQGTPKPFTPAPTTTPVVPKIPLQTELSRKKEDLTKTSTAKTFGTSFGGIQSVKPMSVPEATPVTTPGKVKSPQDILAQKYSLQPQFPGATITAQTEADKARTKTPLIDTDRTFMERLVSTNTPLFGLSPLTRKQYQEAGYDETKFQDLMDTFEQSFMDTFRGTKKAIYGPLAQSAGAAGIISPETLKSSEMKYEDLVAQDAQRKIDQPYKQPRESWNKGIEEAFNDGTYKDPGYWMNMVSQVVGQLSATVPAMVVGSAVGGPVGAGLAVGAMMYGPTTTSVYEDLKASGVDSKKAGIVSSAVGIPLAALDFLGERMQLKNIPGVGKIFNKIKKEATEKIVEYTTAQIAKKSAKELVKSQLGEGMTEAAQQIIQNATVKYFDKDRDLLAGVLDSFVVGAVGASPFGMMGMAGKVKELRLHNEEYRNMSEDQLKKKVEEIESKGDVNGLLGHEPEEKFQEKPDTYLYLGEQIPMETKKGAVLIDQAGGVGKAEERIATLENALKNERLPSKQKILQDQIDRFNAGIKEYQDITKAKFQEKEPEAEAKVTSRFIEDLDKSTSKEMVSRQTIENQTKRQGAYKAPELKYVQDTLAEFEGDKIPKKEFIESLRSKMIELSTKQSSKYAEYNSLRDQQGYEPRNSYSKIYEAPFTTKGAETHYHGESNKYFAHSRVEEVGTHGNTNRVVEIQSDLFQRQRYKREGQGDLDAELGRKQSIVNEYANKIDLANRIMEMYNAGKTPEQVKVELDKEGIDLPHNMQDAKTGRSTLKNLESIHSDYTSETASYQYLKDNNMDLSNHKLVENYFRNIEYAEYETKMLAKLEKFLKDPFVNDGKKLSDMGWGGRDEYLDKYGIPANTFPGMSRIDEIGKVQAVKDAIEYAKGYILDGKTKAESYLKDIKEAQKVPSQIKSQHLEDYANRRHERVVREEIAQAAKEGKKYVQLPDPKTIAMIEGYLSEGQALPEGLQVGEEVDTPLGERGIIIVDHGDSYDVVPKDAVKNETTADEWIKESFDRYIEDVRDSSDQLNYEEAVNFIHDSPEMTKAWKEEFPQYEGIPSQERDVNNPQTEEDLAKFVVDHSDEFENFFNKDRYGTLDANGVPGIQARHVIESEMRDFGFAPVINDQGKIFLIESGDYEARMESVGKGAGADNEDRYDSISEDQRAVVDFYKNKLLPYAEKLTKGRSEYVEEDGGRWLQIEINPEDKKAVEAFQSKKTDRTMKTPTTPEQAKQWTENFFKKLVDEGIITTEIKDKIMTPTGLEAYGRYKDALISFAKDPIKSTAPHESFHAAFDLLFTTEEKMDYLEAIKKESGAKNYTEAEEWLADKFAEEADKLLNNKPSSYKGKVAEMFARLRKGIKALFGNKRDVDTLFSEIMKRKENVDYVRGKRAKEVKKFQTKEETEQADREKTMMENFKRNDPDRQNFINRVAKIEAEEQRIGKVAGKKVGATAKDAQMRLREKRKEQLIEDIGQHYSLDANEARDMYDEFVNVPVSQVGAKAGKPDIGKQVRSATAYRAKGNPEGEARALDEAKRILAENAKPDKEFTEEFYEQNKPMKKKKQGTRKQFAEFVADRLEPISYRLGRISKKIQTRVREFDFSEMSATKNLVEASRTFLDKMAEIGKDKELYHQADLALKNGDMKKLNELGIDVPKDVLDLLYQEAVEQGIDVEYRKNYFPRVVENAQGLLDKLRGGEARGYISDAIRAREKILGRQLDLSEKAEVANKLLSGYSVEGIKISVKNLKERSIDVITADLNQFYKDPVDGFLEYIAAMTRAIEMKKLFGNEDPERAIGTFVAEMLENGTLKPEKEQELTKILQARFSPDSTSKVVSAMRSLISLSSMGSPISTLSQIQDLANSMYIGGLKNMLKPRKIDMTKDLGIDIISQEFMDPSKMQKFADKVFTATGFRAMDRLGKQTLINTEFNRLIGEAKKNPEKLKSELMEMFDVEKRVDKIIEELQNGELSYDGKFIVFNRLADFQPITQSEMPYTYLKGGKYGGANRLFYTLKSFAIKQIASLRREGLDMMKDGMRKKWEARKLEREGTITQEESLELQRKAKSQAISGARNLIKLAGLLTMMGMATDELKDFILARKSSNIRALINGNETTFGKRLVENLWKLPGLSKYSIMQAGKEGIGKTIQATIGVPTSFADQAWRDLNMILTNDGLNEMEKLKALETIQSIPVVGKLRYRWLGQPRMTQGGYTLDEGLKKPKYYKDVFSGEIKKKKGKKSSFSF